MVSGKRLDQLRVIIRHQNGLSHGSRPRRSIWSLVVTWPQTFTQSPTAEGPPRQTWQQHMVSSRPQVAAEASHSRLFLSTSLHSTETSLLLLLSHLSSTWLQWWARPATSGCLLWSRPAVREPLAEARPAYHKKESNVY